jgi:hypothetical protein
MKENKEKIIGNASIDEHSVRDLPGEQMNGSLFENTQSFPEKPAQRDQNSSEILKIYLQNLRYCARKRRRHYISQGLGR